MELAFGIPQAVLQVMIGGLATGEFAQDETLINGSYFEFWSSFVSYDPAKGLYSTFVYNDDYNIMYGAFWPNTSLYDTNNIFTYNYNGTCAWDDYWDYKDFYCDYNPEIRPWYNISLTLKDDQRKWTDLYKFAGSNQVFGMTMVQQVYYNGIRFVFGVDYTITTIQSYMNTLKIPLDGVLYLANHELSIMASTVKEVDIQSCDLDVCKGKNNLLLGSINYIRKNEDNLNQIIDDGFFKFDDNINLATIATFDMTWTTNYSLKQTGIMVIAYSDAYLDDINSALWVCVVISAIMVIASISIIILVQKAAKFIQTTSLNDKDNIINGINNHKNDSSNNRRSRFSSISIKPNNRYIKFLASLKDNNIKRLILMSKIGLCLTLGIIYIVLNNASNVSFTRLVEKIMVKGTFGVFVFAKNKQKDLIFEVLGLV